MFCGNCGEKIPDESLYCMFCGKPATPAQPDAEEEPLDSTEEEWDGRAIWEACRLEQQNKQFGLNMEEPLDSPEPEILPEVEPQPEAEPQPEPSVIPELPPEPEIIPELPSEPDIIPEFSYDPFTIPDFSSEPELDSIPEFLDEQEPDFPDSPYIDTSMQTDSSNEVDSASQKVCKRCGKPLSETSISEYCLDCLYSPDVLNPEKPEFDALPVELDAPKLDSPEKPIPPRKNRLIMILLITIAVLAVAASAVFLIPRLMKNNEKPNNPSQSTIQRQEENLNKAIGFAQEMVKEAAYAPDSIHFDASTAQCTVEAGDYTVTQQFERQTPQGEVVTATYTAILNLGGETGYIPIMLKVDESILFDYR